MNSTQNTKTPHLRSYLITFFPEEENQGSENVPTQVSLDPTGLDIYPIVTKVWIEWDAATVIDPTPDPRLLAYGEELRYTFEPFQGGVWMITQPLVDGQPSNSISKVGLDSTQAEKLYDWIGKARVIPSAEA